MKTVLTVDCEIPGGFGEHVQFFSKASLLDGEFVLFQPTIPSAFARESYQGKPLYPESYSFQIQEAVAHWQKELADVLKAGKTVFFLLSEVEQAFVYSGQKTSSGTGRNHSVTKTVTPVSNYDLLPFSMKAIESKGISMSLVASESLLREYWRQFGDDSSYCVHLTNSPQLKPLVTARGSDRVVGGIIHQQSGGAFVLLPWIDFYREEFFTDESETAEDAEDDEEWTNEAKAWGAKFCDALESLDKAIRSEAAGTPAPPWIHSAELRTLKETSLTDELDHVRSEITNLEEQQNELEARVKDAGSLKGLLYEQGIPLEHAVLKAMRLIGFEADSYRDSDSEFDGVLECSEGRCIGEVEGRDHRAIDINKMRQLEVNVLEDFSRDEVSKPAKGILFGNGYRLTHPSERPAEQFTAKCVTAAERNGTVLIRTSDLFEVAKALSDFPDADFATACRETIFNTKGKVVTFPPFPEPEPMGASKETHHHEEMP